MIALSLITLLGLQGCSSPEADAAQLALAYTASSLDSPSSAYDLVCAEDQAAKDKNVFVAELELGTALLGAAVADVRAGSREVTGTVLNAEKNAGSVDIKITTRPQDGREPREGVSVVQVRQQGDGWCVVTGWAEEARLQGLAQAANDLVNKAANALSEWAFDEAEQALGEAAALIGQLPDAHSGKSLVSIALKRNQELLETTRADWVGGRWRVTEDTDPMTDVRNVTAMLQSTTRMPDIIGSDKPATLIVRCNRAKLEAFVSTPVMLDSDWRYDSVTGQHRFGSAAAERLSGTVSTDRQAVFLRDPKAWLQRFQQHEHESWTVELPRFSKTPASVRFDLAATTKAFEKLPSDCR
jgi:hypothetical protein